LPGGYGDVGLSPKENIIKEVQEETNLLVTPNKLLAVFDTNLRKDIPQIFQYYKLVFACQVVSNAQAFEKNIETSQMAYFGLNELPSLSKKRTTKEQLSQLFSQYETCYFE
jgi:DNA phosphorothioation-dependent restriction protein DptG